ncbi:LysE family translocator [Desulfovibrio sp. JC010]|uniref:LysE family translocator n=1 Tax=Desulfovibrio sp. JC010 TaxID=2593641 RepID=UPI0013D40F4D|nr:LysE family translocator [Desulfovibrio sp. JC010]NDV28730.1 LysE family translocator [Desulfovibrio sp. JC010]
MISYEFLITALVVVLIPGTGVIYTVSNGLFLGKKASLAAAAGCTAGILPHLTASVLGLSAILHMSALTFQLMKYTGAAYLLYLAWLTWRDTGGLSFSNPGNDKTIPLQQIAKRGFLINILNPKLSIFFLAFLPIFVPQEASSPTLHMMLLSAIFMLMTFVVFIFYGLCATKVRAYVLASPKIIRRMQKSFALIFASLGLKLAAAEQ